jgi:hypothetical protein
MKYLQKKLSKFDKHNLTVLSSLLLLHHTASTSKNIDKKDDQSQKGGDSQITNTLSSILAPLGVNAFGASVFLVFLQKTFVESSSNNQNKINSKDSKDPKKKRIQQGGQNSLKELIAPLGTSAFIATGILVLLQRYFTNIINEKKSKTEEKKKMYGGRINKNSAKLFNVLAPISFNSFAKKSFLNKFNEMKTAFFQRNPPPAPTPPPVPPIKPLEELVPTPRLGGFNRKTNSKNKAKTRKTYKKFNKKTTKKQKRHSKKKLGSRR